MATQGPNFPGTTATLANAGTSENANPWINPGNIVSDNATEAQITAATYDSPDISELLVASNFGFSIPSNSIIKGITVEIDRRSIIASSGKDFRVQLGTGTTFANLVGANKAATATIWPTTSAIATYGGAADDWTAGLTPAQVNAAGFAVFLSAQANIANADIGVDFIRVTIDYLPTIAPSAIASAEAFGTPSILIDRFILPTGILPVSGGQTFSEAVMALSPAAYFRLGEASGTNANNEASANDGTYSGTPPPTLGTAGLLTGDSDTAATFDGSQNYVQFPDTGLPTGNTAWTIWAIVNPSDSRTNADVVFWGTATTNQRVGLTVQSGALYFQTEDAAAHSFGGSFAGARHCLAITYDGTTMKGWADGVQQGTDYTPTARNITLSVGRIGVASNFFAGIIDEVAIFPSALSGTQIANLNDIATNGPSGAFGLPVLSSSGPAGSTISPSAISSGEALGTATLSQGSVVIAPSALASTEAFGTVILGSSKIISPSAITSGFNESIYGSGIGGDTLGNTRLGNMSSSGTKIQYDRFRAEQSSALNTVRYYRLAAVPDPGYSGGTSGTWKMEVFAADSNGEPTGAALATQSFAADASDVAGFLVTFTSPATLVRGALYCLVYTNTDADPENNFFSPDRWLYLQSQNAPFSDSRLNPKYADGDYAHAYYTHPSGPWVLRPTYTPILDLGYANGQHQGSSYGEASYAIGEQAEITGTLKMARERFTVSGGNRTIIGAGVRLSKITGSTDPLTVRLEDDTGTLIDSFTIPASSIPDGPAPDGNGNTGVGQAARWVSGVFPAAHVLTNGVTYRLRFSTGTSSTFWMWVNRRLSYGLGTNNYDVATAFEDGLAEKTTDGSAWVAAGSATNKHDYQFYLALADYGEFVSVPTVTRTTPSQTIQPTAISSAEALGTPTLLPGSVRVLPGAIASAESFGVPTLSVSASSLTIAPSAIASSEALGTPILQRVLAPTAIPEPGASGTASVSQSGSGGADSLALGFTAAANKLLVAIVSQRNWLCTYTAGGGFTKLEAFDASVGQDNPYPPAFLIGKNPSAGGETAVGGSFPSGGSLSTTSVEITGATADGYSGAHSNGATVFGGDHTVVAGSVTPTAGSSCIVVVGVAQRYIGSVNVPVPDGSWTRIGPGGGGDWPFVYLFYKIIPVADGNAVPFSTTIAEDGVYWSTAVAVLYTIAQVAIGTPTLKPSSILAPVAIASGEGFGTPTVSSAAVILPGAINSAEAVGNPTLSTIITGSSILPTAIASAESVGTPQLLLGGVSIAPSSISTAEALGTPALGASAVILPTGITSGEVTGNPTPLTGGVIIQPAAISTAEVVSNPVLKTSVSILPSAIGSAEQLGTPSLVAGGVLVQPTGVASSEAVPAPVVRAGNVNIQPNGIPSAEAFSTLNLKPVRPTAISSGEVVGTPILATASGPKFIQPSAIVSAEAVGSLTLIHGSVAREVRSHQSTS